jgi:uroporphyrin-III C-methyltransferase
MEEQSALTKSEPGRMRSLLRHATRPVAVAFIALFALIAWQWYDSRAQLSGLREELARRLRDSDADSRDARAGARQAQEAVREAQAKLAQLEAKLIESQNQQVALEALYQELSRSRDEWVLAEVEQILTIAAQQLQLAGSVQGALAALQTADSRLARSDRPQFLPLRKVLARDIERLKGTPGVDTAGLAMKLDQVIAQVDTLPLAFEERAVAPTASAAARAEEGYFRRLGAEIWGEFKQLVRIRNMERPEPPLLAPSQVFFLRENLKLRLLNARLALLARDQTVFREDLNLSAAWIQRYFDVRARASAAALANLRQLAASGISIDVPSIAESLTAVRNYKVSREKATR